MPFEINQLWPIVKLERRLSNKQPLSCCWLQSFSSSSFFMPLLLSLFFCVRTHTYAWACCPMVRLSNCVRLNSDWLARLRRYVVLLASNIIPDGKSESQPVHTKTLLSTVFFWDSETCLKSWWPVHTLKDSHQIWLIGLFKRVRASSHDDSS